MTQSDETPLPKISIVVLAKNCENYLLECIGSMIGLSNLEIVIVDPGSTDGTAQLVDVVKNLYPKIVTVVKKEDQSPAEGLNNGLNEITGDVVGILNGDDVYLPGCLNFVQNYFKTSPTTQILLMGGIIANEQRNKSKLVYPSRVTLKRIAVSRFGSVTFFHQGMFVAREFAKGSKYNEENRVSWDFEYLAQLLTKKPQIVRSNKHGAIFRIHPHSISGGKTRVAEGIARNRLISYGILGRKLNAFDMLSAIYFRLEKYLESSILGIRDTVFLKNRF